MPDMTKPYAHIQDQIDALEKNALKHRQQVKEHRAEAEILEFVRIQLKAALDAQIEDDKQRQPVQTRPEPGRIMSEEEAQKNIGRLKDADIGMWYRCESHTKPEPPRYKLKPGAPVVCDICGKTATTYGPRRD